MENVVLIVHLILALLLIGAVLLQRSEGGALGIGGGGGGGGGGMMSGRSTATALQKATWGLAAAFITTSLVLTVFATQTARDGGLLQGGAPLEAAPPGVAPLPIQPITPLEIPGGGGGDDAPAAPTVPALPSMGDGG